MRIKALDKLIRINEEAWLETFEWEKSHKRNRLLNRGLLVFNTALFINNVIYLIFNFSGWSVFLAFVALGLLAFTVWLMQKAKEHMEWILEARRDWEADLRHWQAVKTSIEGTGEIPDWAYEIPSRSMVDKS